MKVKLLHLVFCCLLATSVYGHREDYFGFRMGDNPASDGWTVTGGVGEADAGLYGIIADGNAPVVWTRDLDVQAGTRNQPYVAQAILKYITGTGLKGEAHIVPKVILEGKNGESVTFTFKTAPDDDSKVISDTAAITAGAAFEGDVRYIKVVFENVKKDEYVSFNYIDLASQWFMPEVKLDGVIYIQAEDYNEFWINKRKAYSPIGSGANQYRESDADLYVSWQDDGAFFQSWTYGNGHKDDWYGRAVKNMCLNGATWNSYSGEYIDATSNQITIENAKKNWGAWLEYTFDVPENCVADISLKAGSHWGAYAGVSGGTGKFGKSREQGGYTIDGMSEDWVKRYCATAVLSLDGDNLKTNWSSHPKNTGFSQFEYAAFISDPSSGWMNNQVLKNGNLVNSDTLYIFPNPRSGDVVNNPMFVWSTYYKSDLYKELKDLNKDESLTAYIKPDYANITLSKGRHTIKVQSLAPMWHFDEIKIEARTITGVNNAIENDTKGLIIYPSQAKDVLHIKGIEADYTIIDLRSGVVVINGFGNKVDVSRLSTGVYAVKVGEKVQRFIKE